MRRSAKPVRRCYSCPLNLGDHCWLYAYPRGQWRGDRRCAACDDPEIHGEYRNWQKQPRIRNRADIRRDFFRSRRRKKKISRKGPR
ncbi:MAG: hypothetical protein HQ559_10915 [Lentisphaerae bacterium]|nr:hypothetical protein [Lentisphaerota bacterium]